MAVNTLTPVTNTHTESKELEKTKSNEREVNTIVTATQFLFASSERSFCTVTSKVSNRQAVWQRTYEHLVPPLTHKDYGKISYNEPVTPYKTTLPKPIILTKTINTKLNPPQDNKNNAEGNLCNFALEKYKQQQNTETKFASGTGWHVE